MKKIIKNIINDINIPAFIIGIIEALIGAILIKTTILFSAMLLILGGVNIGKRTKEYTVWIPKKNGECQIYIKNKWFNFVKVEIENNFKEDRHSRSKEIIVTDKEYKLIKALREYIDEKEESV